MPCMCPSFIGIYMREIKLADCKVMFTVLTLMSDHFILSVCVMYFLIVKKYQCVWYWESYIVNIIHSYMVMPMFLPSQDSRKNECKSWIWGYSCHHLPSLFFHLRFTCRSPKYYINFLHVSIFRQNCWYPGDKQIRSTLRQKVCESPTCNLNCFAALTTV